MMDGRRLAMGVDQQDIDPAEVTLADIQSRSYLYWNDSDTGEQHNAESTLNLSIILFFVYILSNFSSEKTKECLSVEYLQDQQSKFFTRCFKVC